MKIELESVKAETATDTHRGRRGRRPLCMRTEGGEGGDRCACAQREERVVTAAHAHRGRRGFRPLRMRTEGGVGGDHSACAQRLRCCISVLSIEECVRS